MTDHLAYTPGSGASVATDDRGGVHYQRMLLTNGRAAATDDIFVKRHAYAAYGRAATTPAALSWTSGGAATKQLMTCHHTASSTKTKRFTKVGVRILECSGAATLVLEIRRVGLATTDPATGNPELTAFPLNQASGAAELSDSTLGEILCLPTTAGNDATPDVAVGTVVLELGTSAADSTVNPVPVPVDIVLYEYDLTREAEQLSLTAAVRGGIAIVGYLSANVTIKFTPYVLFTEE